MTSDRNIPPCRGQNISIFSPLEFQQRLLIKILTKGTITIKKQRGTLIYLGLKQIIRGVVEWQRYTAQASSISSKVEIAHFVSHKLKQASMSLQELYLLAIQSRNQPIYIYRCNKSKENDARKYVCSHCIHS